MLAPAGTAMPGIDSSKSVPEGGTLALWEETRCSVRTKSPLLSGSIGQVGRTAAAELTLRVEVVLGEPQNERACTITPILNWLQMVES